jgi:hypothetical protein
VSAGICTDVRVKCVCIYLDAQPNLCTECRVHASAQDLLSAECTPDRALSTREPSAALHYVGYCVLMHDLVQAMHASDAQQCHFAGICTSLL